MVLTSSLNPFLDNTVKKISLTRQVSSTTSLRRALANLRAVTLSIKMFGMFTNSAGSNLPVSCTGHQWSDSSKSK